MLTLNSPITSLVMVGPLYAKRLNKLNIFTIKDLLYHIPYRYEDWSNFKKIKEINDGEKISVKVEISSFNNIYTKSKKIIQKALAFDETSEVEIIWYNQPYLKNIIKPGSIIILSGQAEKTYKRIILQSPKYEFLSNNKRSLHTGRIIGIYPETEGLTSKWMRSKISVIIEKIKPVITETIPLEIIKKYNLVDEKTALQYIHFPTTNDDVQKARRKLSFNELFLLHLESQKRKIEKLKEKTGVTVQSEKYLKEIKSLIESLPFTLTKGQKDAIDNIIADLNKPNPMNRLLEGDVGSGKTVVAAISAYLVKLNGYKTLLMAPTEVLANQHFDTFNKILNNTDTKISIITGKKKYRDKKEDIIIGTHALLTEKISYSKVSYVITDEQQKFGVNQRTILREKGGNPHFLSMTATPIPRTLALTIFSDLDLSVIDEMPKGRIKIKTWIVPDHKRQSAYEWIRNTLKPKKSDLFSGQIRQQIYVICPFIEKSENMPEIKDVQNEFDNIQKNIFPEFKIGMLHGRQKNNDKLQTLESFRKGEIDILVSTPVVEVGVDIPNATIIIIENADRYGLSQLHQLRGRVGRSDIPSYCLLFGNTDNEKSFKRLKNLETVYSGPKLAEIDLTLRGPGEIYGFRQHGDLGLKFTDISNLSMIKEVKEAVLNYLKDFSPYLLK